MADIEFPCPKCQSLLVVDARGMGFTVPCPECGEAITIPMQGEADEAESPEDARAPTADSTGAPAGRCTRCGKSLILTEHEVEAACQAADVPLSWGALGPTLNMGSLSATGLDDIFEILEHRSIGKADMFQSILGSWAPYESCPECGEQWCHECINGPLPDTHLTRPPHCNCA
ncbi:hypothetical protein ACFLSJ_00495 [Verrucomicrobiota bacterium]